MGQASNRKWKNRARKLLDVDYMHNNFPGVPLEQARKQYVENNLHIEYISLNFIMHPKLQREITAVLEIPKHFRKKQGGLAT